VEPPEQSLNNHLTFPPNPHADPDADKAADEDHSFDEFVKFLPFGPLEKLAPAREEFRALSFNDRREAIMFSSVYVEKCAKRQWTPWPAQRWLRNRWWQYLSAKRGVDDCSAPRTADSSGMYVIFKNTPEGDAWTRHEPIRFIWSEKLKKSGVARKTLFPPGYEPQSFPHAS